MSVLVINCGSTSIKIAVVDPETGSQLATYAVDRLSATEHETALELALPGILQEIGDKSITAVGHRVVHGGSVFSSAQIVDDDVEKKIAELAELAPLHNPVNVAGIRAARRVLPDVPHVAVFDTAFHSTLPTRSKLYAIDRELADRHSIRRYGFHGTSHQFVAARAAGFLGEDVNSLRIITCHLGGGCSVCAVEYGRSIETSMGMTPLEGLVMATRSGDIDPGALVHLMREENLDAEGMDALLNRKSGLLGLSGVGADMRDIETAAEEGDEQCRQALQVFCHRVRKYIGAYAAVMGGVDAVVFTAGIGENSASVRHRVTQRMDFLGMRLDEVANRNVSLSADSPVAEFSTRHSRVRLLAVKTDENLAIAEHVHATIRDRQPKQPKSIPVAISARHVHLTQEAVEQLFGEGYQLTEHKPLSQPGQYACNEQVTLVGPKRSIERVRILGPVRSKNQVEISRTDEFFLGVDAPVRASGQTENSPGITLIGTENRTLDIDQGVICALRHIHMTPEDAEQFGVSNGDLVEVEVGQPGVRSLSFGDVLIRVKSTYALEMHIDTDEGNAAELKSRDVGELERTGAAARLRKRSTH